MESEKQIHDVEDKNEVLTSTLRKRSMQEEKNEQLKQEKIDEITPIEVKEKAFSTWVSGIHLVPAETIHLQESAEKQAEQELNNYQEKYGSGAYYRLSRYHVLMGMGLRDIDLSYGEAALIVDCLNGTLMATNITLLPAQISDSIVINDLANKWNIDGEALLAKLRQASPLVLCAIIDAAEKFWDNSEIYPADEPHEVGLKRVGLLRK